MTAEEKGLLGSRYFAAHPTVDPRSIVVDINTDMFLPIVPLKTLMVLGIDESTLGARAAAIADSIGVYAIRDPMPLRNIFIRSDQYSFVLHGVPSVMMSVWAQPGSPEEKVDGNLAEDALSRTIGRPEPTRRFAGRRVV